MMVRNANESVICGFNTFLYVCASWFLHFLGIGQVHVTITDSGMFTTLEKVGILAHYVLQQAQIFWLNERFTLVLNSVGH